MKRYYIVCTAEWEDVIVAESEDEAEAIASSDVSVQTAVANGIDVMATVEFEEDLDE